MQPGVNSNVQRRVHGTVACRVAFTLVVSLCVVVLSSLQVETSCGPQSLSSCFVFCPQTEQDWVETFELLQLPVLTLPATESGWHFLQHFGGNTQPNWPAVLKALQQLSAAAAQPELMTLQYLYTRAYAWALQDKGDAAIIRNCFQQQPLLYVPGRPGYWVTSTDVLWSSTSSRQLFFTRTFIQEPYKVGGV